MRRLPWGKQIDDTPTQVKEDEDAKAKEQARLEQEQEAKAKAGEVVADQGRVSLEGFGEAWTARCRFTPRKLRCVAWKLMSACGACSA